MNALIYLTRKQIKNFFRDLLHHPGRLVAYLVMAALLVFTLVAGQKEPPKAAAQYSDIRILHGIFLGWFLFLGVATLLASLKSGTTMFKMSDVNFLFVSPISPKRILNYGLMKQTAAMLFGFIFLLFYSGMLMENFNVGPSGAVALIVYSVVLLIVIQLLSLLIYNYSNGDPKRKNTVRAVLYLYLGLMVVTALGVFQRQGGGTQAIYAAISSPYLEYFPIIGWTQGAVFGLINGNMQAAAVYAALLAASFVLLLALFRKSDADYYEDVLQSTETQFEARQAMKEKRTASSSTRSVNPGKKARVGKTGLGGGWGADTFLYKHLCEARRRSRLVFFNTTTAIVLIVDIVLTHIVSAARGSGSAPVPDHLMLTAFAVDLYILFLMNAAGDWSRELSKPYIYLVPADPFHKLIWASMTSVLKPLADGAVFFTVTAVVVHANPLTALACFLAYGSFGLLFLAGNILSQRTMGSMSNRGLMAMLFMLLLLLLMAPGIALSVLVYVLTVAKAANSLLFVASLPMIGWNIAASLVVIFCSRNLLSNTEVSN